MEDLKGKKFSRLKVLNFVKKDKGRNVWLCVCDCGNKLNVISDSLKRGNTKSCGCLQRERASIASTTHGMRNSVEYRTYTHMKTRCYNPNYPLYKHYGGRGITVCKEWLHEKKGFANFFKDMGERPIGEYSLDRIDVNGNYTPKNCRWATDKQQASNRRLRKFHHIYKNGNGWIVKFRVNGALKSIGTFNSKEEAVLKRNEYLNL